MKTLRYYDNVIKHYSKTKRNQILDEKYNLYTL